MWGLLTSWLAPLIAAVGGLFLREIVLKFAIMGAIYFVVASLMPYVLEYVAPYLGIAPLSSYLAAVPPEIWYFMDLLRLDFGLPLVMGAYVARFSVRRIPGIG